MRPSESWAFQLSCPSVYLALLRVYFMYDTGEIQLPASCPRIGHRQLKICGNAMVSHVPRLFLTLSVIKMRNLCNCCKCQAIPPTPLRMACRDRRLEASDQTPENLFAHPPSEVGTAPIGNAHTYPVYTARNYCLLLSGCS